MMVRTKFLNSFINTNDGLVIFFNLLDKKQNFYHKEMRNDNGV